MPIAIGAVLWISFITIVFILPQANVRFFRVVQFAWVLISLADHYATPLHTIARHLANPELLHRLCWDRPFIQCRILVNQCEELVHWTHKTNTRISAT